MEAGRPEGSLDWWTCFTFVRKIFLRKTGGKDGGGYSAPTKKENEFFLDIVALFVVARAYYLSIYTKDYEAVDFIRME